jgi:hypothetical protein
LKLSKINDKHQNTNSGHSENRRQNKFQKLLLGISFSNPKIQCKGILKETRSCALVVEVPTILATWEAETGRIMVPSQPGQKKFMSPHVNGKELVAHACHFNYSGKPKVGGSGSRLTWTKSET